MMDRVPPRASLLYVEQVWILQLPGTAGFVAVVFATGIDLHDRETRFVLVLAGATPRQGTVEV